MAGKVNHKTGPQGILIPIQLDADTLLGSKSRGKGGCRYQKWMLTELGLGTSLRRQDYSKAVARAVKNALGHNSISLAEMFGRDKAEMLIDLDSGVQMPEKVDVAAIAAVFS